MRRCTTKTAGVLIVAAFLLDPGLAQNTERGGWRDLDWTYIYEASTADGGADGTEIAGLLGLFDDLDKSWDRDNPAPEPTTLPWEGDLIGERDLIGFPGGAEMTVRAGLGDIEVGGDGTLDDRASDAQTLSIFDVVVSAAEGANRRIYFERFLTDRSVLPTDDPGFDDTGNGNPLIDFHVGCTIIARFRYFSLQRLKEDADLRARLGIAQADADRLLAIPDGFIEHDESPRESSFDQKGMFMVTRRDVFEGFGVFPGPGGIYFGMAEDGDDSWDPSNQSQPPPPAEQADVKIAYILGGPNDENRAFQGSGDARIIDQLKARGASVTVLDDGGPEGHQFYESVDPGYGGPPGPDAVANDHDLVIISSTVSSNNVREDQGIGYRDRGVPFLTWENGLLGKGYAWHADPAQGGFVVGAEGSGTSATTIIDIVDNTHPITSGLPAGEQAVFFTPQKVSASPAPVIGQLAPGVTLLAMVPATPFPPISCLMVADPDCVPDDMDPGSCDLGAGGPPQVRQVFFFIEDESFAGINGAGQALFHNALEWALGDDKAAILGPRPEPPGPPPEETIPSFYINLGATPAITAAGLPLTTRVLKGTFLRDVSTPDQPAAGGDTRVWASLPAGTTEEFLSVHITVEPEAVGQGGGAPQIPRARVRVYLNGATEPAIEIQDHSLDPDILPAIAATADMSGPNDGTGLGMGLWRDRQGGFLEVDYFGVLNLPVPPSAPEGVAFLLGNCSGDEEVNITDAVFALSFLFRGGIAPRCRAACNTNGDGQFDLSDPVYLLQFLFLGGPPPGEPFPNCDVADPAECAEDACPGGGP